MKTSNIILIASFLLMISFGLTAQVKDSVVDRNVTVEREYKPIIQDAGKINSLPKTLEPFVEKTAPKYSNFNLPLTADFNIHTLAAAELEREKRRESKGGFGRVGLGNYFNTLADFAYPIIKKPDLRLDVSLNHFATFGEKAHAITKSAVAFDKYLDKLSLFAGVGGEHEYLKYYGQNFNSANTPIELDKINVYQATNNKGDISNPMPFRSLATDSTDDVFWRFNANLGVRSLPISYDLRYLAEIQFNTFNAHNGISEHQIYSKATVDAMLNENRIGVDFELYNMVYHNDKPQLFSKLKNYSVMALNPYYKIEQPNLDVRLGLKSSFSFGYGKVVNPSLDARAEWKAIPKIVSIYAGVTGGYQVNTMNNSYSENRYLYPAMRINDTYTPLEMYAGLKIKPLNDLLLDAYVDYKQIDNQYFFVNKEYNNSMINGADSTIYSNRFDIIYSMASHLKIGVRANYNLRNRVNVELKGAYNEWTVENATYAWNNPKWEADLSTDIRITRSLSVSANAFLEGARYAKLSDNAIRMRPKIDINLGTSYSYNNWLTFFGKINNLINNPYQEYYGYQVQGINALVGASFSF